MRDKTVQMLDKYACKFKYKIWDFVWLFETTKMRYSTYLWKENSPLLYASLYSLSERFLHLYAEHTGIFNRATEFIQLQCNLTRYTLQT